MADITPIFNKLLKSHNAAEVPSRESRRRATETVDEFLKEAYRINSHISSLLTYLRSIRQPYLSIAPPPPASRRLSHHASSSLSDPRNPNAAASQLQKQHLTDEERDSIDSSTALLLRDLSSSISNLASAETLRQETQATLLRKKYGYLTNNPLWKWAGGGSSEAPPRTPEQELHEETEKTIKTVRENVLWSLRRGLEDAAEVQRSMVEKRIEREKEKEKSVLYKMGGAGAVPQAPRSRSESLAAGDATGKLPPMRDYDPNDAVMREDMTKIESQLSPEQLQLFAQENDGLLKHYEDTLSKVQNAEKSLLEISSLQQTLVAHLATQEDYVNQLVTDAATTHTNVGRGNVELKRAAEKRSTAQAVFWCTVGLCTWLVIWDAIF